MGIVTEGHGLEAAKNREHQRMFKEKMRDRGYVQVTVWVKDGGKGSSTRGKLDDFISALNCVS